MSALIFTPRAARDIDEIYDFTAERWDTARAERYIGTRCEALARGQVQGRDAADIRQGYRRLAVGSHVIFYRVAGDRITVIRILHARMVCDGTEAAARRLARVLWNDPATASCATPTRATRPPSPAPSGTG